MAIVAGFAWAFLMFLIAKDVFEVIPEKLGPLILFSAVMAGWFARAKTMLPFTISGVLLIVSSFVIVMLALCGQDE